MTTTFWCEHMTYPTNFRCIFKMTYIYHLVRLIVDIWLLLQGKTRGTDIWCYLLGLFKVLVVTVRLRMDEITESRTSKCRNGCLHREREDRFSMRRSTYQNMKINLFYKKNPTIFTVSHIPTYLVLSLLPNLKITKIFFYQSMISWRKAAPQVSYAVLI